MTFCNTGPEEKFKTASEMTNSVELFGVILKYLICELFD